MKTYYSDNYLHNFDVTSYLGYMKNKFPEFARTFRFDWPGASAVIDKMNRCVTGFESKSKEGRGESYRRAQRDSLVRAVGIKQLLQLANGNKNIQTLQPYYKILDVLGGDGVLARAQKLLTGKNNFIQPILTSDIDADMITQALRYGLPAIREPARHLFIKNNSFNAVIIAYGTHHIPKNERLLVCREAFRVLNSRGKIIIHDFEESSPIANWFNEVVDKYSTSGHKCSHFTSKELKFYLQQSGFKNIKTFRIYDPFIISDNRKQRAYERLMDYVLNMYGLEKLKNGQDIKKTWEKVHNLIQTHIHYEYSNIKEAKLDWKTSLSIFRKNNQFVIEMPRVALVGVGIK